MILLSVTNASELVAAKVGKFLENLTPEKIDHSMVEALVAKEIVNSLLKEGLKGEIHIVNGLKVSEEGMSIEEGFKIRQHKSF